MKVIKKFKGCYRVEHDGFNYELQLTSNGFWWQVSKWAIGETRVKETIYWSRKRKTALEKIRNGDYNY